MVSILDTPTPIISETSAENPEPFVSSSSNDVKSPTLYPEPPSKIFIFSIDPCVIDSIIDVNRSRNTNFCGISISFDSVFLRFQT